MQKTLMKGFRKNNPQRIVVNISTCEGKDCESKESWRDSLDFEASWESCVDWSKDCENYSGDNTSEGSVDYWENWVEVAGNWENCCRGVSNVSDRKTEERQFHEYKKTPAMWPVTRQIEQWTFSGQESVICPSCSQLKQIILGHVLA